LNNWNYRDIQCQESSRKCPSNGSPVGDDREAWARMRMQIGTWDIQVIWIRRKKCTILLDPKLANLSWRLLDLHDQWSPAASRWAVRISMHNGKLIVK
jgi:hypothetical protein